MSHLLNKQLPIVNWTIHEGGKISAYTNAEPLAVKVWQITNNKTRDFRQELLGMFKKKTTHHYKAMHGRNQISLEAMENMK